jgi:ferredoxin
MARRTRARGIDYQLHYCGRSRQAMAMFDELAALHGDRLHLHVKDEGTRAHLDAVLAAEPPVTPIYVCGPVRMVEQLERLCEQRQGGSLYVEHFAAPPGQADDEPFEVELSHSGRVLQVPAGQTLLSALRVAGAEIHSDCEEGLCGSCQVEVLSGQIEHRDRVLSAEEQRAQDKIITCRSRGRKDSRLVLAL